MDLFGTWDFPLWVNISVVNSINGFTFSSRLWTAVSPGRRRTPRTPDWAHVPALQTKPSPEFETPVDDLFAQHCMLISLPLLTLVGLFFFRFQLGWGKAFVCVLGGGVKNNYPKLFNVLLFFFFSFFFLLLLYHFKFWPQASIWAQGLLEASCFLYLVMNVNRRFYYTKLNAVFLLVCSSLALIPFFL